MQNPFQPNLRKPWILLCTTLLLVYTIMPGEHQTLFYYNGPSAPIEVLMFLLSFPLGDAVAFLAHEPRFGPLERFAFWAFAMALGYAQWFHIFPALLKLKGEPATTLNLAGVESVALPARAPAETKPLNEARRAPTPHFNERGLTPLERIIRDDSEG
ncbi:MAG TPA: hypothetical protein VM914_00010 [Pyrinomonadaceae bacterium]|jgi:hypothetical protein|nr:hypothetical protein [Pyrinomonadaceae bacterium]